MMESGQVRCDQCGSVFGFRDSVYHAKHGEYQEVGFACPVCKARYIACRTDARIQNLQAKVRDTRVALNDELAKPRFLRFRAWWLRLMLRRRMKQVRRAMDRLMAR